MDRQGQAGTVRDWNQPAYSWTVRAVCAPCNNGWMAELEERARDLLTPMLAGRGRRLHAGGQQTLATWALKTALMLEHTRGLQARSFPTQLYHDLYTRREPPASVRVWMASYAGDVPAFGQSYGLDVDLAQSPDRGVRDIFGATVGFGPVAFQVFGSSIAGLVDEIRIGAPPVVHQIWPGEGSFTWTPSLGFDDGALIAFSDVIVDDLRRRAGP
jgi:hypothetical protein